MNNRVEELDFLKCIFILLMVAFHLASFSDAYPYAHRVVYTFHMSAFLLLSGYLARVDRPVLSFMRGAWWLFFPYAVMEVGYVIASTLLPVREQVGELSAALLLRSVFVAPFGPYWYLHTLLLCNVCYYGVYWLGRGWSEWSRLILLCLVLFGVGIELGLLSWGNALYYAMGVAIGRSGLGFLRVVRPSWLVVVPLVWLCSYPELLDRALLSGVAITGLVVSGLLWLHNYLPTVCRQGCYFVGRNTLPILLFSPLFTMAAKFYRPLFAFDPSGMCFMAITVGIAVAGCLGITWAMDRVGLSRWFVGRVRMLS